MKVSNTFFLCCALQVSGLGLLGNSEVNSPVIIKDEWMLSYKINSFAVAPTVYFHTYFF
jgi:hypothetical protein